MIEEIRQNITEIISQWEGSDRLPSYNIQVKQNTDQGHGDFSSNIALQLAKPLSQSPLNLAKIIADKLVKIENVMKVEVAGPGFINIFINKTQRYAVIPRILKEQGNFAQGELKNKRILVEFVSANPTGPLHVGHGRGAVYGDSLVRLLKKAGFSVETEYYINDAGRQMDILVLSVLLRYAQIYTSISTKDFARIYPANAYQGDYIIAIVHQFQEQLSLEQKEILAQIDYLLFYQDEEKRNADLGISRDKEVYLDQLIAFIKHSLSQTDSTVFSLCKQVTLELILEEIKTDLHAMGVHHDYWFSEQSLVNDGSVAETLEQLKSLGKSYEKEGAIWFASTAYGDDKDRVLVRKDGLNTYLTHDIAYHKNKFDRGYDRLISIWGADHHGYIARMKAAIQALGYDDSQLDVPLVQFANLMRGEEKIAMSTRSGDFVSLRELRAEIGNDATRFFYNLNRADQHLNFDLSLALEKSNDNPVFYVQYAYARIQSIFRRLAERDLQWQSDQSDLSLLDSDIENNLMRMLSVYPQKIQDAAQQQSPHRITLYVRDLAVQVHQYYNQSTIMVEEVALRNARLDLLFATGTVLKDALDILGVSAPHQM